MARFSRTRPKSGRGRPPVPTPEQMQSLQQERAPRPLYSDAPLDLSIESVTPGGKALSHTADGQVVFVDLGVPGQEVRARVTRRKSGYLEAQRLEVLKPAPEQAAPFCEHFGVCGGCVWQEIPYARQLEFKRAHILESLGRLGRIDGVSGPGGGQDLEAITGSVLPSPEERHFRGKVELVFGQAQGPRVSSPQGHQGRPIPPLLGFRRLGSHEVVDIAACPIADARLPELLSAVRDWAAGSGLRAYDQEAAGLGQERELSAVLRFLVVRTSRLTRRAAVELITAPAPQAARRVRELGEALLARLPWVESFTHSQRRASEPVAYGEEIVLSLGAPYLGEGLAGFKYDLSPASFFQTNPSAAEILVKEALRLLAPVEGETLWDLYAGVGAFSLPLAAVGARVTGLEANPAAVADARRNAEVNGLKKCVFLSG